ncbi:hypothetical protein HBH70_025850 [Parastagonospora nodorum]|nr:hypothetical protein HBH53_214100 [Parastagonospora nodorum]KAH3958248.1 hypothetical protein HBH51_212300 [Parastagonospora nodorum]KAH3992153.1 hypothetical protein HBI10_222230 [Parastagonospora nodorum]KAH4009631.1 hypothetical protein HBI13_217230 [Parastagonospora nodorum]KAH4043514.1 hypothetical protein HBH49_231320 [Parastagonospora nodorum]
MTSMNRKSSTATNTSPARSKGVQQSPLDLLKQKLGRDAQLLDEIPTHAVHLVVPEGPGIEGYAGEAIKIGTIVDGGAKWTLQAFITTINRKSSGLPEVKVFGFYPEFSQHKPFSVADVLSKAELRDEFKLLKTYDVHSLAVVIKTCFILKGFELPRNCSFTPRFIRALSKVCRKYRDGADKMSSSPFSASDADSSPVIVVKARPAMRKSEQRGPRNQMFGPLRRGSQAPASPIKSETLDVFEAPFVESANGSPSVAVSARAQEVPKTPTPDPRLRAHQSITPALPPVQTMTDSANAKPSKPATQDPEKLAFMRDVSEYVKLREESDELDRDLDNINNKVAAVKHDFREQIKSLQLYIKSELRHKHKKQIRELYVKQKSEADLMNTNCDQMEAEQEKQTKALHQQQEAKITRKEVLQRELGEKRTGFSFDQLLDFVTTQQRDSKKRKRQDSPEGF